MRRTLSIIACAAALLIAPAGARAAGTAHTVVYFPSWSALIDDSGQGALAAIAAAANLHPDQKIALTGYASTVGSTPANTLLAELRAQVVLDALVADGVPAWRITLRAVGPTSFALDPIESRRVEISLGEP